MTRLFPFAATILAAAAHAAPDNATRHAPEPGCEPVCPADLNGDGGLDVLDFVVFQGLWQAGDPLADCDDSGGFDVLDFVCYQGLFQEGCEPPSLLAYDDQTTETNIHLLNGGTLVWIQRFEAGEDAPITNLATVFGRPGEDAGVVPGEDVGWAVYDGDGSGDILNATLVVHGVAAAEEHAIETFDFQVIELECPVQAGGELWVAVWVHHTAVEAPAPLDQDNSSVGDVWVAGDSLGFDVVDPANLGSLELPPVLLQDAGFEGVWLLRANEPH